MRISAINSNYSTTYKNGQVKSSRNTQFVPVTQPNIKNNNQVHFTGLRDKWARLIFFDKISTVEQKSVEVLKDGRKNIYKYFDSNAGKKYSTKTVQDKDGKILGFTKYNYKKNSKDNQLISTTSYDKNNNFLYETKYTYDKKNHITKTADYDKNGSLLHSTEYEYSEYDTLKTASGLDKDGNIIKTKEYRNNGKLKSESYYKKQEINDFMQKYPSENSVLNKFKKQLGFEKYNVTRNYDKDGHVKNLVFDMKTPRLKFGTDKLEFAYDKNGKVDKIYRNKNDKLYNDKKGEQIREEYTPMGRPIKKAFKYRAINTQTYETFYSNGRVKESYNLDNGYLGFYRKYDTKGKLTEKEQRVSYPTFDENWKKNGSKILEKKYVLDYKKDNTKSNSDKECKLIMEDDQGHFYCKSLDGFSFLFPLMKRSFSPQSW